MTQLKNNKTCIAFIFARGGSKGIPRKNIKLLNGKPLIAYSIESALASPLIDRVIVSTDDEEIAEIAREYGAEVPFLRPEKLASDHAPEWMAWRHAIEFIENQDDTFDVFVSLPPTAPLRSLQDIEQCINALDDDVDVVITAQKADRSPYFNMVTLDANHHASLVIKPDSVIARRQDAPAVYDMSTAVYVTRPQFVLDNNSIFSGSVKAVILPPERAVDIDTPIDFMLAELILKQGI
nr:acylneuraminate cytidylyltransferase family protein [Oleiphilus messinensis]